MPPARDQGFTLLELMLVIGVIMVLSCVTLAAVSLVRGRAERFRASQTIATIIAGLRTYALEDRRHLLPLQEQLYPTPTIATPHALTFAPEPGASAGVLSLLVDIDVGIAGRDHRLCDPWGRPYAYQLVRPQPAASAAALDDWNWDAEAERPRAWNAVAGMAAPYPYVWSTGPDGSQTDAGGWIHVADR